MDDRSDDEERKLCWRNTTNKRCRHGYVSQTSSTGSGVRGRKHDWRIWMFEDTKIATWRSVVSEKDVVDCRACRHRTGNGSRCMVVWIGAAVDWYILFGWTCAAVYGLVYFSLNCGRRLSTVWYILVGILAADCPRSGIFQIVRETKLWEAGLQKVVAIWQTRRK